MNRDAQEVNEIFEDVTVRLFASRISRRHVEKKRRVEKGKRKGKKQRSWQRKYVPRFLSRGISWMIAGDLLEPYWYLSNLESYGAAVGVRSISRKVDTQILAPVCDPRDSSVGKKFGCTLSDRSSSSNLPSHLAVTLKWFFWKLYIGSMKKKRKEKK